MQRYKLIAHTADTGLSACGKTLAESFANAAYGMFSIMTDLRKVREKEYRIIELNEADLETILFEWLNSLLYYFDTDQLLFKRFDIELLDSATLKATCYGEQFDPSRHKLKIGIKSATYHMLSVDQQKNLVTVLFDI